MDKAGIAKGLLNKIETAVDNTLLAIIRGCVGQGFSPTSAISLVRTRLDLIETMAREESREAVADVLVPGVGDERSQAEAWMEALHPEASARLAPDVCGERGVQSANPRREEDQPDNQADLWDDGWVGDEGGGWQR
jgi:hypothetical protein